jgi:exodeoxyribonuclease-1
VTEAEFLKIFFDEVVEPDTIFLGYNTVRFDDEFMRFTLYRNFYDAYEWQWCDNCSKWDMLDVVRMTRALRPDGIEWPFNEQGKATNKLELLTKLNGVSHENAHDALNDVHATIAVARLIRDKQPKLFKYLLDCRHKKEVEKLVCEQGKPFVYSCGRYPAENQKTTIAIKVADASRPGACLVYDLRHDPAEFLGMSPEQLAERWEWTKVEGAPKRLPVKQLQFNRCPAVAPLAVLDDKSQERIGLTVETASRHIKTLLSSPDFADKLARALEIKESRDSERWTSDPSADGQLYDGFIGNGDKTVSRAIRAAKPAELTDFAGKLQDKRLKELLPLYKARNYPDSLSGEERQAWEAFIRDRLVGGSQSSRLAKYFARLQELAAENADSDKTYLLEELQLYGQSIMPADAD